MASTRVRFYPYRVTYIYLHDFLRTPNNGALPVYTKLIRAKNSEESKTLIRSANTNSVVLAASRHPERLGALPHFVQHTLLTKQQIKVVEREAYSGKIPHAINPAAFVAAFVSNNPGSTIHTRPTPSPKAMKAAAVAAGVGAPRTALRSTPIPLSNSALNVGGFTVGFKRPGEDSVPTPTTSRKSPQIELADLAHTTVNSGAAMLHPPSVVEMPSGAYQFTAKTGTASPVSDVHPTAKVIPVTSGLKHPRSGSSRWVLLGLAVAGVLCGLYFIIK